LDVAVGVRVDDGDRILGTDDVALAFRVLLHRVKDVAQLTTRAVLIGVVEEKVDVTALVHVGVVGVEARQHTEE